MAQEHVSMQEAARELFVAGYHQALEDLEQRLGSDERVAHILILLRSKAAAVVAKAAISKASA